ncbi:RidA family protein [candidate division KSB1 bacterium]|nr:MAG: RidA family protein [candidate division KSB1 bacterium]RPH96922.1 MAG: RidA family protein [candidate division KSB1 bacterium]
MKRDIVSTAKAPQAIGPYSQGIRFSGVLVYTAGQIPVDPATGQVVGKTTAEQTEQVLRNLTGVVEAAGGSMATVVKVTVFLKNMSDFAEMNEVYGRYFPKDPPARSAVEVARLPKDVLVEIECLALVE